MRGKNYFKTGIEGLDGLFKDGIPKGSSILVEGGPGSGKTIMCLQTCFNAAVSGKKVLYMSFEEPEYRLIDHMESFGFDVKKYIDSGNLVIKRFNTLDIAKSVEALLTSAKRELLIDIEPILFPQNFKPDFIVMDSISAIASAFAGEEHTFRIYMEQLFRYLESDGITSFLIYEVPVPTHIGGNFSKYSGDVSFLSDGIITIYNVYYNNGIRDRALEIFKMRGEDITRRIVKMTIDKNGVTVYPTIRVTGDFKLT